MKKKILLAVVLSGTLTVGALAHNMNNQQYIQNQNMMSGQQGMMNIQNQQGMYQGQKMGMHSGMMGRGMHMFSQLNLTDEQRFQLSILRDEMRLEMKKLMHQEQGMGKMNQMSKFIKENQFDKNSFKKHMNEKHKKMLDLKADSMEKVFKLLTKEQITQLNANSMK